MFMPAGMYTLLVCHELYHQSFVEFFLLFRKIMPPVSPFPLVFLNGFEKSLFQLSY